jgi:hypothetical protein
VVQYGGLRNGKVVLLRSGVATQSDATTMSQTPLVVPTTRTTHISGSVGSSDINATATSSGTAYIPPRTANVTTLQNPVIPIEVDWRTSPRVPIAGRVLVIQQADPTSITFVIE